MIPIAANTLGAVYYALTASQSGRIAGRTSNCPLSGTVFLVDTPAKSNNGKWLTSMMIGLGLAIAIYGWWFAYQRTRPVLEYFGPEAVAVIRAPTDMTAMRLLPGGSNSAIQYSDLKFDPADEKNVFAGRGYTNARASLIKRETYDWRTKTSQKSAAESNPCEPAWTHALRLTNEHGEVVVLLSLDCPRVALSGKDSSLTLHERIASGFAAILKEELESEADDNVEDGGNGNAKRGDAKNSDANQ